MSEALTINCRENDIPSIECCSGDIALSSSPTYTAVPPEAFKGCNISSVIISTRVTRISTSAFESTKITAITIPTS